MFDPDCRDAVPLRPFNLDWDAYVRMFNERPPERLAIVVKAVAIDSIGILGPTQLTQRLNEGINEVLQVPENSLNSEELLQHLRLKELSWRIDETSSSELSETPNTSSLMHGWSVDNHYIQLGFKRLEQGASPIGISLAMLGYDQLVVASGSTEPKDHRPNLIDPITAQIIRDWIGEEYALGAAIWGRELLDLRNRWLVTLRAIAMGRDPHLAYSHFVLAGGKYFLEYPVICP